jgi:uncharacterized membrane protein
MQMKIIGHLHPLLIHFPIALVIFAVIAEAAATLTRNDHWSAVAIRNARAGAVFALLAAVAGWRLALNGGGETSLLLEWHRWLGTAGAGVALAAALLTGVSHRSSRSTWLFRIALLAAGLLVAAAGHLGGVLVWGADFLRP